MLRFEDVALRLGQFALCADFDVPDGATVAIMGASGSGKSTLLNLVAGFLVPDAGHIWMAGRKVSDLPVSARPLSILFQDGNLFPHLGVFDNVALGIAPDLKLDEAERARVTEALAQVGLEAMAARKPADLSGGQQSRVALARMLLREQPLTLLDEPFAALDPGLRREMLDLVGDMCAARGQTLLMVTHDLRDAERVCDRLILLEDGRVTLNGDLQAFMADAPAALEPWM